MPKRLSESHHDEQSAKKQKISDDVARDKAYVIVMDRQGYALMGLKRPHRPVYKQDNSGNYTGKYTKKNAYCGNCPSIFGGNIDPGFDDAGTLVKEAMQESHDKIIISEDEIRDGIAHASNMVRLIHCANSGDNFMTFYMIESGYEYNPDAEIDEKTAKDPNYMETTGDIIRVKVRGQNFPTTKEAADAALTQLPRGIRPNKSALRDFYDSGSVEALMHASRQHGGGQQTGETAALDGSSTNVDSTVNPT